MMVLLKFLFVLLSFLPVLPACFFFFNGSVGRFPKNKREWIIGIISLAYVPIYVVFIRHWVDLKL